MGGDELMAVVPLARSLQKKNHRRRKTIPNDDLPSLTDEAGLPKRRRRSRTIEHSKTRSCMPTVHLVIARRALRRPSVSGARNQDVQANLNLPKPVSLERTTQQFMILSAMARRRLRPSPSFRRTKSSSTEHLPRQNLVWLPWEKSHPL